jgi:hypothetical protein
MLLSLSLAFDDFDRECQERIFCLILLTLLLDWIDQELQGRIF